MKKIALIIVIKLMFGPLSTYASADPQIRLNNKNYSLNYLKTKLPVLEVLINSQPAYQGKIKRYRAFSMPLLLKVFFKIDLKTADPNQVLEFSTNDHYLSKIPLRSFIKNNKSYLAFEEIIRSNNIVRTEDKKWSLIYGNGKIYNPGPYYLIWQEKNHLPHDRGWPFQITSIRLLKDKAIKGPFSPPKTLNLETKGFYLFMTNCSVCHGLYYYGARGKAPDLALVTQYLNREDLIKTIKQGGQYMPSFTLLSINDINAIIDYLKWVSQQEEKIKVEFKP